MSNESKSTIIWCAVCVVCVCVCCVGEGKGGVTSEYGAVHSPNIITLKVLVTTVDALGHFLNRILTAQWEGMGDVGSARYEPALLPPCPTIRVLSYSNCQRSAHAISKRIFRNVAL